MVFPQSHVLLIAPILIPAFSFLISFYLAYKKNKKEYSLKAHLEDLQGRINIAYQQLESEELRSRSLRFKLKRYDALAALTERLNQNLSLPDTLEMLLEESVVLFSQGNSICLVYLLDNVSSGLSLWGVRGNSDSNIIVKEKQGDIFDQWVIKHQQSLLVEDVSNDFRFDLQRLKKASSRKIGSLIACCMMSHQRPMGVLRLDSPFANSFTLEDLRLLSTVSDIASVAIDNALYYQNIKELAIKDSLTGLYTRKFILERLDEEIRRCLATTDSSLSLLMIDIDFFKKYNDQYGHLAGDAVLRNVSLWLCVYLKEKNALIGRYGGEEFIVVAPGCTKEEAFSLAENIRSSIQEKKIVLRRKATAITVSVGIAHFPNDAATADELLNKADMALYEAKKLGRNRVCLY